MKAVGLRQLLEHVRDRLAGPDGEGLHDGQLLSRFVAARDEASFGELVARHGPLVLGVCRRVLRHEQDAEDAFQAAFLVLARQAGALGRCDSVGGYLHRVAYRIALRARAGAARRAASLQGECEQAQARGAGPAETAEQADLRRALDAEIDRLPAKYRAPFVLCHLAGQSNAEAARELGCKVGTLESWLTR